MKMRTILNEIRKPKFPSPIKEKELVLVYFPDMNKSLKVKSDSISTFDLFDSWRSYKCGFLGFYFINKLLDGSKPIIGFYSSGTPMYADRDRLQARWNYDKKRWEYTNGSGDTDKFESKIPVTYDDVIASGHEGRGAYFVRTEPLTSDDLNTSSRIEPFGQNKNANWKIDKYGNTHF